MDIEAFAKCIKKEGESDRRWTMLMFFAMFPAVILVFGGEEWTGGIHLKSQGTILGILLLFLIVILFTGNFCNQYLRVMKERKLPQNFLGYHQLDLLYDIVKTHSFHQKEYFSYIKRKLLLWQAVILVYMEGFVIFNYSVYANLIDVIGTCLLGILLAGLPTIILLVKQKRFEYDITHTTSMLKIVLDSFFGGIRYFIQIAIVIGTYFLFFLIVWLIVQNLADKSLNFNQEEIIYRGYGQFMSALIVMMVLFIISCILYLGKKSSIIRLIIFSVLVIMGGINIVLEMNCYTEINLTKEKMVIADFEGKQEYWFDDVKSFKVSEKEDELKLWVTLYTGENREVLKKVRIFDDNFYTNTDQYTDTYQDDKEFVTALTQKFTALGAEEDLE